LAQLHLGAIQRLSRDVDLLAKEESPIEAVLDSVAARYRRRLYTWSEDQIEGSEIPMRRFSVYFPSASQRDVKVPLKLDVSYVPVDLPTDEVLLSASAVYAPTAKADAVTTLSVEAFIADKLPTLGFDTHGYARPVAMAEDGNPEHIWKQLHDLGGLLTRAPILADVLAFYRASIEVRNQIKDEDFTTGSALDDALRVCRIAIAAWAYPRNVDVPGDENYEFDVTHVRAGIAQFRHYLRPGSPSVLTSAARVALLVAALTALERREDDGVVRQVVTRTLSVSNEVGRAGHSKSRDRLRALLNGRDNPSDWIWPVRSRDIFGSSPADSACLLVAGRFNAEMKAVAASERLTFEA